MSFSSLAANEWHGRPGVSKQVLSAESEDELYKSVKAWVVQRHPDAKPLTQEFRYASRPIAATEHRLVPDDRALFILRTLSKVRRWLQC